MWESLPRFFYDGDFIKDQKLILDKTESNHCIRVIRCKKGDFVELVNGKGGIYKAHIIDDSKNSVELILKDGVLKQKKASVSLFVSVLKKRAMDNVIKRATEIGVSEIFSVITNRSVIGKKVGLIEKEKNKLLERWNKLAKEAMKQSGSPFLPKINEPILFKDLKNLNLLNEANKEKSKSKFFGSLDPDSTFLVDFLNNKKNDLNKDYIFFVGPEGDFTDDEITYLRKDNFEGVKLTNSVLRSDVACIYGLSILDHFILSSNE